MKRIWVIEVNGADAWTPAGVTWPLAGWTKKKAKKVAAHNRQLTPGLRFRVRKYKRVRS